MAARIPAALTSVVDLLRCPTCHTSGSTARELRVDRGSLRCPDAHTFDVARHGYVSLLAGVKATSGDDADMVRARERFLGTGSYDPIRHALTAMATPMAGDTATVLDVGCGTGHYLAHVLDGLPRARGLGLDTSVPALRMAARVHDRAAAATWDVFRPLPVVDAAVDVVLDVFAPRHPAEFHRVLRPGGRLVVVRPTQRHLAELRRGVAGMVTVDPTKEDRLHHALDPYFLVGATEQVEFSMALTGSAARDMVEMSPSARHVDGDVDEARDLPDSVTVSVLLTAFRPR